MRFLLMLLFICVLFLDVACKSKVIIDPSTTAMAANDVTLVTEGCGNQPVVGYTYCRTREGAATADKKVTFLIPQTDCISQTSCASLKIFYPDGEPAAGYDVPKKQTRFAIAFDKILKRSSFTKDDRGFWPVVLTWRTYDQNKKERSISVEGEIRMRVLSSSYVPLQNSSEAQWVWVDSVSRKTISYSTSGRALVSGN